MNNSNIQKLTGKNFQVWEDMMIKVLKLRGLYRAVTQGEVDPNPDLEAQLTLMETMDEANQARVRPSKSAKEMIERLNRQYADESAANLYRLLNDYFKMKKTTAESMGEHLAKLEAARMALEDLGETQSDGLLMVTLFGSLSEEYEGTHDTWETMHPSQQTTANLFSLLFKKDKRLTDRKEDDNTAMVARARAKPKENSIDKPFEELSFEEKKRITRCGICKQKGHWARECPRNEDKKFETKCEPGRSRANILFALGAFGKTLRLFLDPATESEL